MYSTEIVEYFFDTIHSARNRYRMQYAFDAGSCIVMDCSVFFSSVLPFIESLYFLMLCVVLKDIDLIGNVLIGKELLAVPPYPPITLLHIPYLLLTIQPIT